MVKKYGLTWLEHLCHNIHLQEGQTSHRCSYRLHDQQKYCNQVLQSCCGSKIFIGSCWNNKTLWWVGIQKHHQQAFPEGKHTFPVNIFMQHQHNQYNKQVYPFCHDKTKVKGITQTILVHREEKIPQDISWYIFMHLFDQSLHKNVTWNTVDGSAVICKFSILWCCLLVYCMAYNPSVQRYKLNPGNMSMLNSEPSEISFQYRFLITPAPLVESYQVMHK